jgi:ankyrin repeat protein
MNKALLLLTILSVPTLMFGMKRTLELDELEESAAKRLRTEAIDVAALKEDLARKYAMLHPTMKDWLMQFLKDLFPAHITSMLSAIEILAPHEEPFPLILDSLTAHGQLKPIPRIFPDQKLSYQISHGIARMIKHSQEVTLECTLEHCQFLIEAAARLTRPAAALIELFIRDTDTILNVVIKEQNDIDLLKYLIAAERDRFLNPALFKAAENGLLDMVTYLVEQGANINYGYVENGSLKTLEEAEAIDADDWQTPLFFAIKQGHRDVALFLLGQGANPEPFQILNKSPTEGPRYPLHQACQEGDFELVTQLVNYGANPSRDGNYGMISLHYAAQGRNVEIVQYLIGRGVPVDAQDHEDRTPMHVAKTRECARALHEAGAGITLRTIRGETPLHSALMNEIKTAAKMNGLVSEFLDMAQYLVEAGIDVNTPDIMGNTPLDLALQLPRLDFAQYLLQRGAVLNLEDKFGRPRLHAAVRENYRDFVQYLLEHGADVNSLDEFGRTALHEAIGENHPDLAQCLLEHGADVNVQDQKGRTPLHEAVMRNQRDIAQSMLKQGANTTIRDNHGRTALDMAQSNGNQELIADLTVTIFLV